MIIYSSSFVKLLDFAKILFFAFELIFVVINCKMTNFVLFLIIRLHEKIKAMFEGWTFSMFRTKIKVNEGSPCVALGRLKF